MKSRKNTSSLIPLILLAFVLFLAQSCVKPPVPAFSYSPTINPEAGDSIFFINESIDAISYSWDFGDGYSSTESDPYNIYVSAGSYDVTLTATNEKTSTQITQTIMLNEPTTMALFIFEDDSVTPVENCEVWVYDSQDNWENDYYNPQYVEYTDSDGFALFLNFEAQQYVVDMYKEEGNGYWYNAVLTPVLTLNSNNIFAVALEYNDVPAKKGLQRSEDLKGLHPKNVVFKPL